MPITASTDLVSAQSIGGTAGYVLGTQTSADASTSVYLISNQLTLGAGAYPPAQKIRVWFSSLPFDLSSPTAAVLAEQVGPTAHYIDIPFGVPAHAHPGKVIYIESQAEILTGAYIYCWVETPALSPVCTISIKLQELG